jgi:hypothetical protein
MICDVHAQYTRGQPQEMLPWSDQTLGTMNVTDHHLGHRGRVCSGSITRTRSAEFRGGALENVGTASTTADAADDA